MKVLYSISQKPGFTGSGFYVQSLIKQALLKNHKTYLLYGIQHGDSIQLPKNLPEKSSSFVEFNTENLPYAIPGMSDVMPYVSTRFRDMTEEQLTLYEQTFKSYIQKAVLEFKPDVIHSNHLWLISSYIKELFPEIPLIITCHGTDLRQIENCPHLKERVIEGCRKADAIIALNEAQKGQIASVYSIPEDKIRVIGSGFDEMIFSYSPKRETPPVTILYAGKLSYAKGVLWLLSAIASLSNEALPFHLYLAGTGSGEEYEQCITLAKALDTVTLCGMLNHAELSAMMKKAHIFILPSFYEGLPLVLLEALACGCRVISTKLPGTVELAGKASEDIIKLIELPTLETIDSPYEKDMPTLVSTLATILKEEIVKQHSNPQIAPEAIEKLISNHTWKGIFSGIEKVSQKIISKF